MEFTKAHGTGNDFVVLADVDDNLDLDATLVRALCDRRFGLGADGVLRIGPSERADVFMDYRNADGTAVEMCGNGVRVVAKYVLDRGIVLGDELLVDTRSGVRPVYVGRGADGKVDQVTVDMGAPVISELESLDVEGRSLEFVGVDVGNPHAVLQVDDVTAAPVTSVGPRIEKHVRFPEGVNVEFARVVSDREIELRVWERGVGETLACGTGACATQAALHALGKVGEDVLVHVPGGTLRIRWTAGASGIEMTGPAVEVASGTIGAGWLQLARARVAEVVS